MMWALHALSDARRKLSHGEVRGGFGPWGWSRFAVGQLSRSVKWRMNKLSVMFNTKRPPTGRKRMGTIQCISGTPSLK